MILKGKKNNIKIVRSEKYIFKLHCLDITNVIERGSGGIYSLHK